MFCGSCYNYVDFCDCVATHDEFPETHLQKMEVEGESDVAKWYFVIPLQLIQSQFGNMGLDIALGQKEFWTKEVPLADSNLLSIPLDRVPYNCLEWSTVVCTKFSYDPWDIKFFDIEIPPLKEAADLAKIAAKCLVQSRGFVVAGIRCARREALKYYKEQLKNDHIDFIKDGELTEEVVLNADTEMLLQLLQLYISNLNSDITDLIYTPIIDYAWIDYNLYNGTEPPLDYRDTHKHSGTECVRNPKSCIVGHYVSPFANQRSLIIPEYNFMRPEAWDDPNNPEFNTGNEDDDMLTLIPPKVPIVNLAPPVVNEAGLPTYTYPSDPTIVNGTTSSLLPVYTTKIFSNVFQVLSDNELNLNFVRRNLSAVDNSNDPVYYTEDEKNRISNHSRICWASGDLTLNRHFQATCHIVTSRVDEGADLIGAVHHNHGYVVFANAAIGEANTMTIKRQLGNGGLRFWLNGVSTDITSNEATFTFLAYRDGLNYFTFQFWKLPGSSTTEDIFDINCSGYWDNKIALQPKGCSLAMFSIDDLQGKSLPTLIVRSGLPSYFNNGIIKQIGICNFKLPPSDVLLRKFRLPPFILFNGQMLFHTNADNVFRGSGGITSRGNYWTPLAVSRPNSESYTNIKVGRIPGRHSTMIGPILTTYN